MYRLMVVEDEVMIRNGIVNGMPWNDLGFEVVGEGKNGKHALDFLQEHPVDVLLTDIKMPIMGGIELAKKVRRLYPDIEIIVLSGYSDFEYAREAISFRAYDYLLKPTDMEVLIASFQGLKKQMDDKRERKEEIFHTSMYTNAGYESLRKEFLMALLDGESTIFKDFEERTSALELDFGGESFVAATVRFDRKSILEELTDAWERDKRLLKFAYDNIIKEALSNMERAYFVVEDYDIIHLVYCFDGNEDKEKTVITSLETISENIQNCLFKHSSVPYTIGVGLFYPSVYHLSKSHIQAKRSIQDSFYQEGQSVQVYKDTDESGFEQNYIQFYPMEMQKVAVHIANGDGEAAVSALDQMFERLIQQKLIPEIVKNYCVILRIVVQSKLSTDADVVDRVLGADYSEFVKDAISVKYLHSYVTNAMSVLAEEINKSGSVSVASDQRLVIEKAKVFIRDNLSKKVNLKMISEHVYLSETYFSFLFKKVTGITYIEYIQKIRMEEAKRLLLATNYKIYEVADMIGYNDYKYFSIQFKKYVLMTPKAYRNKGRLEVEG